MPTSKKWFTCTPVRFVGDHTFFARDSGLLCKGFQEIGVECESIMPGPAMDVDQTTDLIRTDYRNLEDPEWWQSLGGEGVVFYGWGSGKYVRIVRAIKKAGLKLVTHMDTAGILGIFNGIPDYSKTLMTVCKGESQSNLWAYPRFAARMAYASTIGLIKNDFRRAQHLKEADFIGAITPIALERIQKVCRIYGGNELAGRVKLIPHPNSSFMRYDARIPKESLVVAIGRWDDSKVKGTELLMESIGMLAGLSPETDVEIYGKTSPDMVAWHQKLPEPARERVKLMGIVRNDVLAMALQRAKVSLCTSLRESYHIASAENLCCGGTVVGPDVPEVPSMKWFTESGCGRLAPRSAGPFANAVLDELQAWDRGERNPQEISNKWTERLHAPKVAEQILKLAASGHCD
jgi:hypothetical protein